MSPIRTLPRLLVVLAAAALASGCITLFPKAKDAQLYRFEGRTAAAKAAPKPMERVGVVRVAGTFTQAAASDRILTVTGEDVAYLANSRWATPAQGLFDEAVLAGFNANAGPAQLISRGEPAKGLFTLRLDVERFETQYDQGPKAAPKVVVQVHAVLVRAADRQVVGDRLLRAEARMPENRVSAIVKGYDAAVAQLVGELVAWANTNVAG